MMNSQLVGFENRMVRSGDVNINTVVGGRGSPLVLLHGFPQTWWEWHGIMPALAAHHTVVAVDLRGAGHSDCPQGGYDKANMAGDVHGVMHALGFDRYAVCGHDIGSMVALALAFTHKEAVTHLAVMDAGQPGWSEWKEHFTDPALWHFPFHMKRDVPELLITGREYDYVSAFISERAFVQHAHSPEDVALYGRALAQPGNLRGGLEWYRAFPTDHENALGWKQQLLEIPVLALGGDHKYGARMVPMLKEFAVDVGGGSITDCGPWLPEEQPLGVTDALLKLLST